MEEVSNITGEEVKELVKDFPVQPLRGKVIITVNAEEYDSEVLLQESSFSETQYVLASSPNTGVVPGTRVLLDLDKITVKSRSATDADEIISTIKLKPITVNGQVFALINDNVIDAIDGR